MKKVMNIPMNENLYNRDYCMQMAHEITDGEKISGMTLSQLYTEIFAHAYIYYNFRFLPKCLKSLEIFKKFYNSVSNGVDLEDNGDKWYRRIAYRFIWLLPAFQL